MNSLTLVELFVEDQAHEEFLKAMLGRIADEEQRKIRIRVRSARGGHGRALEELSLYQKGVLKGPIPDDNARSYLHRYRRELQEMERCAKGD